MTDKQEPEGVVQRPPRDNLVRAIFPGVEFRSDEIPVDGRLGTLTGHFAVFNQWTPIDSAWEGNFMEQIAPGAFRKTFAENRAQMQVTFNHGRDPQLGDKVLGPIESLEEDDTGAAYNVPLLDTSYNRDLLPALKLGLYGASFRFRVMKEDLVQKPKPGPYNPDALPERTVREVQVSEFGPVTYPAYAGATAGVRSMTDDYILSTFLREPERLRALIESMRDEDPALPDIAVEAAPHSDAGSRVVLPPRPNRFKSREDYLQWLISQTSAN
ncbi:MAG: HK97 family phage prohead protease [Candidatus Limnocylindria bacterium]